MKYLVIKFVEAKSAVEALQKSQKLPIHEVYIHTDSWKDSGYSMDVPKFKKLGFTNAQKDKPHA